MAHMRAHSLQDYTMIFWYEDNNGEVQSMEIHHDIDTYHRLMERGARALLLMQHIKARVPVLAKEFPAKAKELQSRKQKYERAILDLQKAGVLDVDLEEPSSSKE